MLPHSLQFSSLKKRIVQAQFSGGHISSDSVPMIVSGNLTDYRKSLNWTDSIYLNTSLRDGSIMLHYPE